MATLYQSIPREYPTDCTCTVAFGHGVTHAPYCEYVRNLYQSDNPERKARADGTRTPRAKAKAKARNSRKARALVRAILSVRGALILPQGNR